MFNYDVNNSNMWREVHEQPELMKNVISTNKDLLKKIAEEVKERKLRNIVLVGRGSSEHALIVGRYAFEVYTDMVATVCAPSVVTQYDGKMNLKDSLVIGVSQCGEARDVYSVLKKCEDEGGLAVSITNEEECLMRNVGKYYVNCACGKELSFTAAKSYMAQTILMLLLASYLSEDADVIRKVENGPTIIDQTLNSSIVEDIKAAIPLFRNTADILLLGRGFSFAVANEAELKIMEASYTNAKAYSSCDYPHGPIATTNRYIPIIMYLCDEKTDESSVELLKKLQTNFKVSCLVVTNKEKYKDLGNYTVMLPKEADGMESVFSTVVFSQLFACLLSFARGYNPDEPIGLSKVTVTF